MKQKVKHILGSPIVISILLATIVIIAIPPLVPRHTTNISYKFSAPNRLYTYFKTSDSTFSDVSMLKTTRTSMMLENVKTHLYYKDGFDYKDYQKIYCPINPPDRNDICLEDLDNDSIIDIVYISQENDSIFLIYTDIKNFKKEKRIFLSMRGSMYYSFIRFFYFKKNVVYFTLMTREPNKVFHTSVYAFNKEEERISHIHTFDKIVRGTQLKGIDNKLVFFARDKTFRSFYILDTKTRTCDSIPTQSDIIRSVSFVENSEIAPYDYASEYLICHNHDSLFYIDTQQLIEDKTIKRHIITHQRKGDKSFYLKYVKNDIAFFTLSNKHNSYLYKYHFKTRQIKRIRIKEKPFVKTILYYGDLDENGRNELIYINEKNGSESYAIYEDGIIHNDLCSYPIGRENLSAQNSMRIKNQLRFQSSGFEQILTYSKNPKFYIHWLWCSLIAMIIIFVGIFAQKLKEIRIYRKQQMNNKILQLQLENVQKRIDPHFIFNSLNNLGSMILQGDTDQSYDYLSQVSGVLYKALRNRGILVTVEDELTFCTSVLDTQKMRFKDKFDYDIFVDKEIDIDTLLPSNILNSMSDNCIKHGFANINYKGRISIELLHRKQGLLIIVEDNGKGRLAAKEDKDQKKSTGTGLEICRHYVQLLNINRKTNKLSFKVIDLYTNNNASGTRCEFYIPNDLKLTDTE